MPSHLNRVVFRKLLASEPIAHRAACLCPRHHFTPCPPHLSPLSSAQRRSFFNLFKKPPRAASEPRMAPGLEKMMEYSKMERLNARLPPPDDVLKAVTVFFDSKQRHMPDVQAQHLLRSLAYIDQHLDLSALPLDLLSKWLAAFHDTLGAFHGTAQGNHPVHREIIILLYRSLRQATSRLGTSLDFEYLKTYIESLCRIGETSIAREFAADQNILPNTRPEIWKTIANGFVREGDEPNLLQTFTIVSESGASTRFCHYSITKFYTYRGDSEKAHEWYEKSKKILHRSRLIRLQGFMLAHCIRASNLNLGQSLIRDMTAGTPTKEQWDFIMQWAVATGKGADEIERMMNIMERENRSLAKRDARCADTITLNMLVNAAVFRKDPYLAERLVSLGRARNIQPDALTLVYQMQYRLASNDVDGALTVYKHLQSHDLSGNHDIDVANELIRAMCASRRQDFDSIMNIAADLSDRQAPFHPETVSALSVLHLSRNEVHDVIDLLNTHAYSFDQAGRALVLSTLIDFCLKSSTTTAQAWDAYVILKQIFDDTTREQRVKIMAEFFKRQRADMAVHVFNHMRSHTRQDVIPDIDTYVACLSGITKLKDEESLEVVHNQIKLDFNIEPTTRLYNALMQAYTACEAPRTALGLWDGIASSREGPDLSSIHLALRACEDAPWGDEKARQIWQKLGRTGIELDQALWASYAAALIGNGNVDDAINTLEEAHVQQGPDMDTLVIGSLYNATPGQVKRGFVESWARERYPDIWAALEKIGTRPAEVSGLPEFKIDRHVEP